MYSIYGMYCHTKSCDLSCKLRTIRRTINFLQLCVNVIIVNTQVLQTEAAWNEVHCLWERRLTSRANPHLSTRKSSVSLYGSVAKQKCVRILGTWCRLHKGCKPCWVYSDRIVCCTLLQFILAGIAEEEDCSGSGRVSCYLHCGIPSQDLSLGITH